MLLSDPDMAKRPAWHVRTAPARHELSGAARDIDRTGTPEGSNSSLARAARVAGSESGLLQALRYPHGSLDPTNLRQAYREGVP